jgi:hypothetical protein
MVGLSHHGKRPSGRFPFRTSVPVSGCQKKVRVGLTSDFVFFYLRFLISYFSFIYTAVIPASIERRADDILGLETSAKYKSIKQKLGGTRVNRIFQAFGVKAPSRIAAAKHKVAEDKKRSKRSFLGAKMSEGGGSSIATSRLEKEKKRKSGVKPGGF